MSGDGYYMPDQLDSCADILREIVHAHVREVLDEIAEHFDHEARDRAENTDAFGPVRQAEAAATYVRVLRDARFP
jgi:cytosine/adenosine deaminase-related metal-dependent hydrolase